MARRRGGKEARICRLGHLNRSALKGHQLRSFAGS
jgi:hypothetical protein